MKTYTAQEAAERLGVSTRQIYKAAKNGTLPATRPVSAGRTGWTYVFKESDLENATLTPDSPGPDPKGDADVYIAEMSGRYVILGTHNRSGQPYHYKRLAVARRRARAAYGEGLWAEPGETVELNDGPFTTAVTVLEGITYIDQTAILDVLGTRMIVPKKHLERK